MFTLTGISRSTLIPIHETSHADLTNLFKTNVENNIDQFEIHTLDYFITNDSAIHAIMDIAESFNYNVSWTNHAHNFEFKIKNPKIHPF
jgi:hypothetical protein